ncbi:unnamed protein product [Linum trigynum]|uniref:Uncharacterized protein n=1 Tax=Linum trigynum TaxID=586398 RepID=A0AAV2E2Z9_9ROSI
MAKFSFGAIELHIHVVPGSSHLNTERYGKSEEGRKEGRKKALFNDASAFSDVGTAGFFLHTAVNSTLP